MIPDMRSIHTIKHRSPPGCFPPPRTHTPHPHPAPAPRTHTPHRTALIEMIPDALSIHTIKHRSPPGCSFSDHFFAKFGRGMPECLAAQRKFTESLAAYSIITYLLQVRAGHHWES